VRPPIAVLALIVALAACTPSSRSLPPTGVTRTVAVQVSCDDHSITFSVTPWAQHLDLGDDISWAVAPVSNTQDIIIDKRDNDWAFKDGPPRHAKPNSPAHAARMKSSVQHNQRYRYTLEADCQNGTGPRIHGKIDPDMIID
jgi:hypothetical protein